MKSKIRVTIYTRPGCHLCDEARREILRAGRRGDYTLEEVNIETDPALTARYGLEIPVVKIGGTVAFKYRLTAAEFRKQLATEAQRHSKGSDG
jgi:glutaredoxin